MRIYQPQTLNTLDPFCGPQGYGMQSGSSQTIDNITTVALNQINPVPYRSYSIPVPSKAYAGLSEKRKWYKTAAMIVSPLYGTLTLLKEKSASEENKRFADTKAKMLSDIRAEWLNSGKQGDVFKNTSDEADKFMETAILGRIQFFSQRIGQGNDGAKRVNGRHLRVAEQIAKEWDEKKEAKTPPPPPPPPAPEGQSLTVPQTPGTAPQTPAAPGSIKTFLTSPLYLGILAVGIFFIAKKYKYI